MLERVQFAIDGMGCGACVAKVRSALDEVPGLVVEGVRVGSAQVRRDPDQVTDAAVVAALAARGYSARKEASHGPATCCSVGTARAAEPR